MKKRNVIIGSIVAVTLALVIGFFLYPAIIIAKFNDHLLNVSHIDIDIDTEKEEVAMYLEIAIRKETPFHKLLDSISYTVNFDTFQFVQGATGFNNVRQGPSFDSLTLPVLLDLTTLQSAIKKLQNKDTTSLEIRFVAHYDWPIVNNVAVPIKVVRRMPPPNPPEVELVNVDIEKFSFNEPIIDVTLNLINKNNFELILDDLFAYMKLEDLFESEVHHPEVLKIKSNATSRIDLTVKVSELKAIKTAWKLLITKKEVRFDMHVTGKYLDERSDPDPIDLDVTTSGTIDMGK